MLEADLVVALASAAVGDGFGAFFSATSTWCLAITGRAIEVPSRYLCLVDGARPDSRIDVVADELLAEIEHHRLFRAGRIGLATTASRSSP